MSLFAKGGVMRSTFQGLAVLSVAWVSTTPATAQERPTSVLINAKALPDTPENPNGPGTSQKEVAAAAQILLETVVRSPKFRTSVTEELNNNGFDFGRRDFKHRLSRRVSHPTRVQVWKIVSEGIERDRTSYPTAETSIDQARGNRTIDIAIAPTPKPRRVVGSTALGSSTVHTATWFLAQVAKRNDAISLARHLMHEWMHSAGFFHAGDGPNQKDIAYRMGDLVRQLATTPGTSTTGRGLRDELLAALKNGVVDGKKVNLSNYLNEDDLAVYWLENAEEEEVSGYEDSE